MAVKKFTKADLVSALHGKSEMSRKEVSTMLDLFLHEIKSALMQHCVIELRGFGTFEVKVRKARSGVRNPRTGEAVSMRSHGIVSFRPGRELKQDVRDIIEDETGATAGDSGGLPTAV
ncbi:MAG: integration host factor subunit beta [Treponema sp.]|nr:integration host factor subunit beta [Treponema sp.]